MSKISKFVSCGLLVASLSVAAHCQLIRHDKTDTAKVPEELRLEHTRSAWRATPTDLAKFIDTVSPSVRAARDAYWDKRSGAQYPLTGPPQDQLIPPVADYIANVPTAQLIPGTIWVLAVFESSSSFLSRSERSIYTEVSLRVEKTYCGGQTDVSNHIDLGTEGGSILLRSGVKLNYQLATHQFDLEPGHRYLLQLSPIDLGHFYIEFNSWEIENGKLRGNSYTAVHGRRVGTLPENGESEESASKKLDRACKQDKGAQ